MRIAKKKMLKFLRIQTQSLPPDKYKAFHKYNKPMTDKNEEGKMMLVAGEVEEHSVNHKRRAWRMYKRHGWSGVTRYFSNYGFKIVENETT